MRPPLGIALRADGFSAVMLVTAALIMPAAGLFARANFATPWGAEKRAPLAFWILLQGLQAALSLSVPGRGSVQPLCRARASHLRRSPARCSRRTSGDGGGSAALSPVRAVRLGALSAWRRADVRSVRDTRHRAPCIAYSRRAWRLAGGGADDRGTIGEDRALPLASVAASGARQRARRGQRRAVRARGQGIVLPRCPALV